MRMFFASAAMAVFASCMPAMAADMHEHKHGGMMSVEYNHCGPMPVGFPGKRLDCVELTYCSLACEPDYSGPMKKYPLIGSWMGNREMPDKPGYHKEDFVAAVVHPETGTGWGRTEKNYYIGGGWDGAIYYSPYPQDYSGRPLKPNTLHADPAFLKAGTRVEIIGLGHYTVGDEAHGMGARQVSIYIGECREREADAMSGRWYWIAYTS